MGNVIRRVTCKKRDVPTPVEQPRHEKIVAEEVTDTTTGTKDKCEQVSSLASELKLWREKHPDQCPLCSDRWPVCYEKQQCHRWFPGLGKWERTEIEKLRAVKTVEGIDKVYKDRSALFDLDNYLRILGRVVIWGYCFPWRHTGVAAYGIPLPDCGYSAGLHKIDVHIPGMTQAEVNDVLRIRAIE